MTDTRKLFADEPIRPCGKCNVCCTVMAVDELEKPMWTRCEDLSSSRGCSRYDTRPQGCRVFECLWRRGLGTSRARPDKSGMLFVVTKDEYGLIGIADRKQLNSWKKGEAKRLIDSCVGQGIPVFVATPGTKKVFLPSHSGLSAQQLETMKERFMKDTLS